MKNLKELRLAAAGLLILSCFTHFAEAIVYEPDHAYGSMVFGLIFFVVGVLLFVKHAKAYHAGLLFSGIGLIAAITLIFKGNYNFLLAVNVVIDIFVIYVCLNYFNKKGFGSGIKKGAH